MTDRTIGQGQLIALLAMSMALAALGIDMILPAYPEIRPALGLSADSTAVTGLVTAYFVGLAAGQLVYGPVADRVGRRPVMFAGFAVYAIGALMGVFAGSLTWMLVARFVWGLGASGPRAVTLAIVRDRWEGEAMSRAMSFIMAVFILVPIIAPSAGSLILVFANWQVVFLTCVLATVLVTIWAARRLPETLREEYRRDLTARHLFDAARQVVTDRQAVAYTLAMTMLYGGFTSYLGSSEVFFDQVFGVAHLFPFLFAALAAAMGGAMILNSQVVQRFGTRRLSHTVMIVHAAAAITFVGVTQATAGRPPLWAFMLLLGLVFALQALMIPNYNTIAMQPMAAIAGTAASVIGAVQLAGGALLGAVVDRFFDGTVLPFGLGILVFTVANVLLVVWGESGRLFQPLTPPAEPVVIAPVEA